MRSPNVVFVPMSILNHQVLAKELQKLAIRFGFDMSDEAAMASVIEDVKLMAIYLGTADSSVEMKRRSVLVVPVITTRSADYWIFGQAAFLSSGTTTVFCNAVSKGAVGGAVLLVEIVGMVALDPYITMKPLLLMPVGQRGSITAKNRCPWD
ncbi:hypothetical protein ACO0K3_13220 [Undibacterium sp. Rencai35W]|uniref:hypothetical protein n=1 Tax=Undibacterium sp. Rencai35W TaxID=3413046 RepID=UPI003BF246EC